MWWAYGTLTRFIKQPGFIFFGGDVGYYPRVQISNSRNVEIKCRPRIYKNPTHR